MNRKYNWGILATGGIARKFASDLKLLPNAVCYAVASRDSDKANEFARKFGFQKAYGSYEALADDPDIDIVYIASPHTRHYKDSLLCLENKKAVLCEKPVAMNSLQFNVMVETAQKNGVFFMEALWTKFIPSFIKCMEYLKEGVIGEIKLIESDFCFKAPYDPLGRLFNPMLGGGALLDIGLYPVFFALEAAGLPEEIKASSVPDKTGVDSSCSMLFRHNNNVLSVLFCSLVANGRVESLIHGSRGTIRLNKFWHIPTTLDIIPDEGKFTHLEFPEPGFGYQYEAVEVMRCLDRGQIQSDRFSWKNSRDLITTLDKIRKIAGISYSDLVEAV